MAEKYFELSQTLATGNGSVTYSVLVINPEIANGGIKATVVGKSDGKQYFYEGETEYVYMYKHVAPHDILMVGSARCEERVDEPFIVED